MQSLLLLGIKPGVVPGLSLRLLHLRLKWKLLELQLSGGPQILEWDQVLS